MNTKTQVSLLFIVVCFIWGTTWLAMELAVATIPPITATGIRFAVGAPLIILLARMKGVPIWFPKGKGLEFILISLFYFAIPFTLMIFGEQFISSGLASIIFANMPVAVLILSVLLQRQKVAMHQLLGLIIALGSLVTIIGNEMSINSNGSLIGVVTLVAAVLMHALIYTNVQTRCQGIHVLTYNALPCLVAAVFLMITGYFMETPDLGSFSAISLGAVIYLGSVAGIGGIMAYFQLNKLASPFQASICFLIFPVIALCLDSLINGRMLSHESIFLTLLLMLGVLLTKLPEGIFRNKLSFKRS